MKIARLLVALSVALLALGACTTTGTGSGEMAGAGVAQEAVAFSWTSTDGGNSGTMSAMLPDETFAGRFFQITHQTRAEVLMPLWTHWHRGWYDWPYWSGPVAPPYPATQFVTHYSGKVVATLESTTQQRMRCRFHLVEPSRGMSGGGEGQCQLSGGRVVRAAFPGK